jgi:hypothetical protein
MDRDSGQQIGLARQSRIGGVVELEQMLHLRRRKPEPRQYALPSVTEFIGDEPVRVVLREPRGLGEHFL